MSKLKKFFTNPKKYFSDSYWFKKPFIAVEDISVDNLFVISHLGQLNQAEALVNDKSITSNLLVVLFTKANTRMPDLIGQKYNDKLFDSILYLEIPLSPNNSTLKKDLYLARLYKALIDRLTVKQLFMQSFAAHYNILCCISHEKGLKINLIEEGTATYQENKVNNSLPLYLKLASFFSKSLQQAVKSHFLFNNFDTVYGSFPSLLMKRFNANKFSEFFLHSPVSLMKSSEVYKLDITQNDYIYVSQRYAIEQGEYISAILKVLSNISSTGRVFIKLHPKETKKVYQEYQKYLLLFNLNERIILIKENEFLIEPVLFKYKPRALLGLSSTTLVYANKVSPSTKSISLSNLILQNITRTRVNSVGINTIVNHTEILNDFTFILQPKSIDELEAICSRNNCGNSNIKVSHKDSIFKDLSEHYQQNNHYQLINKYFYRFGSSIPEPFRLDISLMYLGSLLLEELNSYAISFGLDLLDKIALSGHKADLNENKNFSMVYLKLFTFLATNEFTVDTLKLLKKFKLCLVNQDYLGEGEKFQFLSLLEGSFDWYKQLISFFLLRGDCNSINFLLTEYKASSNAKVDLFFLITFYLNNASNYMSTSKASELSIVKEEFDFYNLFLKLFDVTKNESDFLEVLSEMETHYSDNYEIFKIDILAAKILRENKRYEQSLKFINRYEIQSSDILSRVEDFRNYFDMGDYPATLKASTFIGETEAFPPEITKKLLLSRIKLGYDVNLNSLKESYPDLYLEYLQSKSMYSSYIKFVELRFNLSNLLLPQKNFLACCYYQLSQYRHAFDLLANLSFSDLTKENILIFLKLSIYFKRYETTKNIFWFVNLETMFFDDDLFYQSFSRFLSEVSSMSLLDKFNVKEFR